MNHIFFITVVIFIQLQSADTPTKVGSSFVSMPITNILNETCREIVFRKENDDLSGTIKYSLLGTSGYIEFDLDEEGCRACPGLFIFVGKQLISNGAIKAITFLNGNPTDFTSENQKYNILSELGFKQEPQTASEKKHNLIRFEKIL
jgi:hypothetical protein